MFRVGRSRWQLAESADAETSSDSPRGTDARQLSVQEQLRSVLARNDSSNYCDWLYGGLVRVVR